MEECDSLQALLGADKERFCQGHDLGSAKYAQLRGYHYEVFTCLFLDKPHRIIELNELFSSLLDTALSARNRQKIFISQCSCSHFCP